MCHDEEKVLKEKIRRFEQCHAWKRRCKGRWTGSPFPAVACFFAGLEKIRTELDGKQQQAYRPKAVYHYIQDRYIEPDFVVDVTPFAEQKMEVLKAFRTQFYDPNSKEPSTPITSKNFLESLNYRAQDLGRLVGKDFAEGFTVERCLAVNSLENLI